MTFRSDVVELPLDGPFRPVRYRSNVQSPRRRPETVPRTASSDNQQDSTGFLSHNSYHFALCYIIISEVCKN